MDLYGINALRPQLAHCGVEFQHCQVGLVHAAVGDFRGMNGFLGRLSVVGLQTKIASTSSARPRCKSTVSRVVSA
jgi:hypothetical protein